MRRIARLGQPLASPASVSSSTTHSLAPGSFATAAIRASSTTPKCHHTRSQAPAFRPSSLSATHLARLYSSRADASRQAIPESLASPEDDLQADPESLLDLADSNALPGGDLFIPPPQRTRAEHLDEVADASYVPATKGDGLQTVGGVQRWWEDREHWKMDFVGFKPKNRITDPDVVEAAVRRAVVEALVLQQAGRHEDLLAYWPHGRRAEAHACMAVTLSANPDGTAVLGQDTAKVARALDLAAGDVLYEDAESIAVSFTAFPLRASKYNDAWDKSWKNISLADARLKFAVTKRVFQLTGQRIPDAKLPGIHSVASLLGVVLTPPKPKTLTKEVQARHQDLVELPNISVATKRVTRGDKEKALGRYKLIEAELQKRDLPLDGHGGVGKSKELDWLRGR